MKGIKYFAITALTLIAIVLAMLGYVSWNAGNYAESVILGAVLALLYIPAIVMIYTDKV